MKVPFSFMQGSTLSPQAISYRTRIIANGGTIDDFTITTIDNNLIKPMLTSGIWDCMDKLHLYAGHQNAAAAKVNLINSNYTQVVYYNPLGWLYNFGFYSLGATGALGGYLDCGYNPATAPKWSADRNNCSQFVMLKQFNNTTVTNIMGTGYGTSSYGVAMKRAATTSLFTVYMNHTVGTAVSTIGIPNAAKVWLCGTRSGTTVKNIIDSTVQTYTISSATIVSQNLAELSLYGQTASPNQFDVNGHLASGHGNNNYDNQLLKTYITNTLLALGVT